MTPCNPTPWKRAVRKVADEEKAKGLSAKGVGVKIGDSLRDWGQGGAKERSIGQGISHNGTSISWASLCTLSKTEGMALS